MIRIVIDTDVMVAAFESANGASRQVLLHVLEKRVELVLSTPLMIEYEAVLTRPAVLARSRLAAAEIYEVLDELASICVPIGFDYRWRPAARDPDDDLVLETAVNGSAAAIATFNVRDLAGAGAAFGIQVERPAQLLRRIAS